MNDRDTSPELGEPDSLEDLRQVVANARRLVPVGRQTKLLLAPPGVPRVSLRGLRGLIEYEPSEFTFTAWAGTTVAEVRQTLAEKGQYLPFDPPLADAGCTLGGVVAAGLSGPGRVRFGGIRDFLLGACLLDGNGEPLTVGGRVVKNAAGFDVPKLLVGSLGRLGVITQLTFKVFPTPPGTRTIRVACRDLADASARIATAARGRWEIDAAEYVCGGARDGGELLLRLAGPPPVLDALAGEIVGLWAGETEIIAEEAAGAIWRRWNDWREMPAGSVLLKVPCTLARFANLESNCRTLGPRELRLGCAGTVAWVTAGSAADLGEYDRVLRQLGMAGMAIYAAASGDGEDGIGAVHAPTATGPTEWLGVTRPHRLASRIQAALDPSGTFPPLPGEQPLSGESPEPWN